jgi:hypothetical protein
VAAASRGRMRPPTSRGGRGSMGEMTGKKFPKAVAGERLQWVVSDEGANSANCGPNIVQSILDRSDPSIRVLAAFRQRVSRRH